MHILQRVHKFSDFSLMEQVRTGNLGFARQTLVVTFILVLTALVLLLFILPFSGAVASPSPAPQAQYFAEPIAPIIDFGDVGDMPGVDLSAFDFSALSTGGDAPMGPVGDAGDGPIVFDAGADGPAAPPPVFDFEGFFTEVGDVFEMGDAGQPSGGSSVDLGGLEGVLGDIGDFQGGYGDFAGFAGSTDDLGSFFVIPESAQGALDDFQQIDVSELADTDSRMIHNLAQDIDYFGAQQLGGEYVAGIVNALGEDGVPDWGGDEFAGIINALSTLGDGPSGAPPDELAALADNALGALEGNQFGLLSPEAAAALFSSTVLDLAPGQSLDDSIAATGDDAFDLVGAFDLATMQQFGDQIDDIFSSFEFDTFDSTQSSVDGGDITNMIAVIADEGLGEQNPDQLLSALEHTAVEDFAEAWDGEVFIQFVDSVGGLGEVQDLDVFAGMVSSFEVDEVGLVADQLDDIVANLDWEGADLGNFALGAFDNFTADDVSDTASDDLVGMVNAAAGNIVGVVEENLDAVVTSVGAAGIADIDVTALSGISAGLSSETLGGYDAELQNSILDTLEADLFDSDGLGFEDITGEATAFDQIADIVDTATVGGEEVFTSLVTDGNTDLEQGALDFFAVDLFPTE